MSKTAVKKEVDETLEKAGIDVDPPKVKAEAAGVNFDTETGEIVDDISETFGAATFQDALEASIKNIEEAYGLTAEVRDTITLSKDKVIEAQDIIRDKGMELQGQVQKIEQQIAQLQMEKMQLCRQIFTMNSVSGHIVSAFDGIVNEAGL